MKIKVNNRKCNFAYISLFLIFWLSCMQNLVLIHVGDSDIKAYHVVSIALLPYLITKKKNYLIENKYLLFALILIITSLVNYVFCGFNSFFINYLFAFYYIFLITNLGERVSEDVWLDIIQNVALLMSVFVWVKLILNFDAVIYFFNHSYMGHPEINTFFGGGVNLEASYLAIFSASFVKSKSKKRIVYIVSTLLICLLYSSRSAMLVTFVCAIDMFFDDKNKKRKYLLLPVILILIIIFLQRFDLSFFFDRFKSITTESGFVGRTRMWRYAFGLFINRPIGYGVGNSIPALIKYTGEMYHENNFHNIYIQMFIDLGLIGGIYYLFLVIDFFAKEKKKAFLEPIQLLATLYLFISFLEFRGAEVIIYFLFAVYFQQKRMKNTKNEKKRFNYS